MPAKIDGVVVPFHDYEEMPKSSASLGFGVVELDVDVCQPLLRTRGHSLGDATQEHVPGAIPHIFVEQVTLRKWKM
jgi:hypothetical protein